MFSQSIREIGSSLNVFLDLFTYQVILNTLARNKTRARQAIA